MTRVVMTTILALAIAGCASSVTPFVRLAPDYSELPAADLEAVAAGIEQAVSDGNRDFAPENVGGIVVNTPDIVQAVRTRAARSALIKQFLDSGHAIEQRNGLIAVLRSADYKKATTSGERDRHALLVMGENNSRWAIYEGILSASKLPPRTLSAVQEIFFKARVERLGPGQRYESLDSAGK